MNKTNMAAVLLAFSVSREGKAGEQLAIDGCLALVCYYFKESWPELAVC